MSQKKRVVVLGAGVTGLSAAYRLSQNPDIEVHVFEKETEVGGLCRSFRDGGFILDYGPHKFYTLIDGVLEEMCKIMGDDFLTRDKSQNLYLKGKYFDFPLKITEMITKFPPHKSAEILASFGVSAAKGLKDKSEPKSYEDFIIQKFGKSLYSQIFEPMANKMFGNPRQLDPNLARVRISSPGLVSVIKQLLSPKKVDRTISAPTFHYPKYGFGMIPEKLKEKSEANGVKFHLGVKVKELKVSQGSISAVSFEDKNGALQTLSCDDVVYTIPMQAIADLIPNLSSEIRQACRFVSFRHTIVYYYLLKSQPVLPAMWVFYPESRFRFGRLSEMTKFSPYTAPLGHTALMVDFTCDDLDPTWSMDDTQLGELLLDQLKPLKLFDRDKVIKSFSKRFRNFYPVYRIGYQERVEKIRSLEKELNNILFAGRLGDFNYNNSDQCFDMGFKAAEQIEKSQEVGQGWGEIRQNRFEKYRIVD
jgi:protoporphyrinogen oxidase